MPRRDLMPAICVLALLLFAAPRFTWAYGKEAVGPAPEERIPVEPLGYKPPGSLYMLSGRAFSSLDFIDGQRLLFTFHEPRLMRREANGGRNDNDQVIQAVTLSVTDGKVLDSAEWRMHDRSRYLWPLGDGKFLVRQRNSYYISDATLKLHPYVEVASRVVQTEVSPDGRILVVEHEYEKHSSEEHRRLAEQAGEYGEPPPPEDTQISLVDLNSRDVLAALRTQTAFHVPITSTGYVGVAKGDGQDQFVIRFVPFQGQVVVLGKVASTCTPHENFVSQNALLIESCGPKSDDVFLDAWTIDGKKLWSGHRDGHLVWPNFAFSHTGGRFAVGLLRVNHYIDLPDSLNDEDVREQVVQVYDCATGALLLSTNASPILTGGQNFALSSDGQRLAVLRDGAIEIYKVPPPPPADSANLQAAKKK